MKVEIPAVETLLTLADETAGQIMELKKEVADLHEIVRYLNIRLAKLERAQPPSEAVARVLRHLEEAPITHA